MITFSERVLTPVKDIPEPNFKMELLTHTTDDGFDYGAAVADGRKTPDDPTMLFLLPWSEYAARPDAADRYRMIASQLGARVIAIDNMGVGPHASRIPREFNRQFRQGDFSANTERQAQILQHIVPDLGRLSLMGYSFSMGGAMMASLLNQLPDDVHVDRMLLMETVGIRRQAVGALMAKFVLESRRWNSEYIKHDAWQVDWMNRPGENAGALPLQMVRSPAGYYSYPVGLAKGNLLADLSAAYGRAFNADTHVAVISGNDSIVSTPADNDYLAEQFHALGVKNVYRDRLVGESHGLIDAPRKLAAMLEPYETHLA